LRELPEKIAEPDRVDFGRSAAGLGKTHQGVFLKKLKRHATTFGLHFGQGCGGHHVLGPHRTQPDLKGVTARKTRLVF
jgi:hypothetical protein